MRRSPESGGARGEWVVVIEEIEVEKLLHML
jgi:hypothetical protein